MKKSESTTNHKLQALCDSVLKLVVVCQRPQMNLAELDQAVESYQRDRRTYGAGAKAQ